MERFWGADAATRATYLDLQNSPSEESRLATEANRLITRGLAIISGFEKSTYTADILSRKSSRAMHSEILSAEDFEIYLQALDPSNDDIETFRGNCSICCGDEQIMPVALKNLDTVEEDTTNFRIELSSGESDDSLPLSKDGDHLRWLPLGCQGAAQAKQDANMISSQCMFQCALLYPRSIYRGNIVAIIPKTCYQGSSKKYINHQLILAMAAGLATDASWTPRTGALTIVKT